MSEETIEVILKDFPGARYYPKYRLITWHVTGIMDEPLADKLIDYIEWEEYLQDAPFDRYADLSRATEIRISLNHVFDIARRRRTVRQPVKTAIFADKPVGLAIAQMYARLMLDASMITVHAFDNRGAAAKWLEVPVTVLFPPA